MACALLCVYALAACSTTREAATGEHPKATNAGNSAATETPAVGSHTSNLCADGDDGGRRLNDLAEHVYDGAVADYLLDNASEIGRETTPDSRAYALMLLVDDAAYEMCVTIPERCLRTELLGAIDRQARDTLPATKGAYAYKRARACLQQAGDEFAERNPAGQVGPKQAGELPEVYQERVLPHLVGNIMPVALLDQSSYFGADNGELQQAAVRAWYECYEALAKDALDPARLAERVSHDLTATLECAWVFHDQTWGPMRPPEPTTPATPSVTRQPTATVTPTPTPGITASPEPPRFEVPNTDPGPDWKRHTANERGGAGKFSLMLPPGWEIVPGEGFDSFVGAIEGEDVLLKFDLGFYAREPRPNPRNKYIVLHEDIGGYAAELVLPAYPPAAPTPVYAALTAVYFRNLPSPLPPMDTRFIIRGTGLSKDQQDTAVTIFRSIRLQGPHGANGQEETGQKPNHTTD